MDASNAGSGSGLAAAAAAAAAVAAAAAATSPGGRSGLQHNFLFYYLFVRKSLNCLEGKSMTPRLEALVVTLCNSLVAIFLDS